MNDDPAMRPARPAAAAPSAAHHEPGRAAGFAMAAAAYGLWGVLILYFDALAPTTPIETIGWRIVLSVVVAFLALIATGRVRGFLALLREPRTVAVFAAAGVLVAANWLGFVAAVATGNGLEVALGYFINPLVAVLLGMLVLGERMRPLQWVAVGVALCAVAVLAVALGRVPWYGLGVAVSFGFYGLVKKRVAHRVPVLEGFTLETTLIAPLGIGCLVWAGAAGGGLSLGAHGGWHTFGILFLGVITSAPLLLYGSAARHLQLVELGIMQYLAPSIMFVVSLTILGEAMPAERWIGFGLIWCSLVLFTVDALRAARAGRRERRAAQAAQAAAAAATRDVGR